jgi:transcriptional regulator with XRE-family HTH domain
MFAASGLLLQVSDLLGDYAVRVILAVPRGRVGATRQTIIAVEAEKYAPSLELAFRLARAFRVPFESVFDYRD